MESVKRKLKTDVEDYQFMNFSEVIKDGEGPEEFVLQDISKLVKPEQKSHDQMLTIEREMAQNKDFNISPIVREHRGFIDQEGREREQRIQDEVEKRLRSISEKAYEEGKNQGFEAGRKEVFEQTRMATEEKLENLSEIISDVLKAKHDLLQKEKQSVYQMIRNLTKWTILRELEDDGEYVRRLLEKLVVELQAKSNLLIQVNEKYFEGMPDILNFVQKKLGKIENVRVEVDYDIDGPGMVLESDNGIINGTLNQQLKSIDKLFEAVGLPASNEDVDFSDLHEENIPDVDENSVSEEEGDE